MRSSLVTSIARALVEQDVLVHRRRGRVLHAAEDEVGHHDLRVLGIGIRITEDLGEGRDHVGGLLEERAPLPLLAPRDVPDHRNLPRSILQLDVLAHDERGQVGGMGRLLLPVVRGKARPLLPGDEATVPDGAKSGRDGGDQLQRGPALGALQTGEPPVRVVRLSLRPRARRAGWAPPRSARRRRIPCAAWWRIRSRSSRAPRCGAAWGRAIRRVSPSCAWARRRRPARAARTRHLRRVEDDVTEAVAKSLDGQARPALRSSFRSKSTLRRSR